MWSYSVDPQTGGPEGTGSGCSQAIAKPSWQTGIPSGCSMRMEADVSAVADPQTGVASYDSGGGGWGIVGGTSAASPIIASVFALYGIEGMGVAMPYSHTSAFNDVTSGSNDIGDGSCTVQFECNAQAGYDGPTGWGTPNGTALATVASGGGGRSSGGTSSRSSSGASGSSSGGASEDAGAGGSSSGGGTGSSSGGSESGSSSGGFGNGSGGFSEDSGLGAPQPEAGTIVESDDAGSFPASGSSSAGCGCTTPGTSSSPLESGGAFGLMLGAAALLGSRRKR